MRICFWGIIADALQGRTGGGGELQIALLAKTLARLGHEVVVVDLEIAGEYRTTDGILIIPVKGYNNGIKIFRTLTHRLPGLYSTFVDVKADVYYCRIREYRHIIVYWAARKVKAKFILGLASDLDILNIKKRWKHFYSSNIKDLWGIFNGISSEIVYPYLLRKADMVLVQHSSQGEILNRKGIQSTVLPNLIDINSVKYVQECDKQDFIYVGSMDKRKGFADFYEIVIKSPAYTFKVIGRRRDNVGDKYYKKLATCINVKLMGKLSHEDTLDQIAGSKALISTSPMEGFPNIFIEAWACGVPVLSLHVDPGGVVEREGLGMVAHGDMNKLLRAMNLIDNTESFARKSIAYVKDNHQLNSDRINEIDKIFTQFAAS